MAKKGYRKEWKQEGEDKLPYNMTEFEAGSIASIDMEKKPITDKYRKKIKDSKRKIKVGSVEKIEHGTLKCYTRDKLVVVGLYDKKGKPIQELLYKPGNKKELEKGAEIPEKKFAMEDHYFVGTPWHELDGIALWTVAGLRKAGKPEKEAGKHRVQQ